MILNEVTCQHNGNFVIWMLQEWIKWSYLNWHTYLDPRTWSVPQ
jgi:hypothetical protein